MRLPARFLFALMLCFGADVRAQEPVAPVSTPPRALDVPPVLWPSAQPVPEAGAVEVLLIIGKDGHAQLEGCDGTVEVCDAITAAVVMAEFAPATVNGEQTASRVKVRFVVRPTEAPEGEREGETLTQPSPGGRGEEAGKQETLSQPSPGGRGEEKPKPEPKAGEFGATARIHQTPPTAHALELEEMREVPGTFGDPFRVLDALPGVIPVMTGLPYVYVRGAPPSSTAYYYDDIQMPALFHLALGPAVVHPAMVGPIDFYPGVAPARYGRRTGGVVAGQAAYRPLRPGTHGELELRLVDMQAYVARPIGERGRIEIGGRYGYPGLALKIFAPRSVVQYWDYQTRLLLPLTRNTDFMLVALGSFDLIGQRKDGKLESSLSLQFHRFEARSITRLSDESKLTYALTFGFERSSFGNDFSVTAFRLGPKLWLDTRFRSAKLRFGGDMLATSGRIGDPLTDSKNNGRAPTGMDTTTVPGDANDDTGSVARNNPAYRSASGRSVIGAYAELQMPLAARWDLEAGLRGDVWITGGKTEAAAEPRLLLRHQASDRVGLHAAFGLAYQPAVFLLPLPGLSDVAIDRGLQRAIQSELGTRIELPWSFTGELKLFAHFYDHLLSLDALDNGDVKCDSNTQKCQEGSSFGRMSAYAYGSEFLLRRAFKERISGWLAYTLSKADGRTDGGRDIVPNFDVRHVANLVFQWRITKGWHIALRGYGQSGRFPLGATTETDPRKQRRLPPFFRGDLQLSRIWPRRWGELRFGLDWLNFTFQREPLSWKCSDGPQRGTGRCKVEHVPFPITLPMLGVRGSY